MKKVTIIFSIVLGWIFLSSLSVDKGTIKFYEIGEPIEFDTIPYMVNDTYFIQAYNEIIRMLENKDSLSFKRAEFLVEWAYLKGELNYENYCSDIDSVVQILRNFIFVNGLEKYNTAGNYALFQYFTKPSPLNNNMPFKYDFEDFTGTKDFSKLFITKVMKTHTGQCASLPMYYKVLSDELGAESFLALAPNHMYIKHLSENGKWVNIELTNGHFATDAWMISSMDISAEAIKNRVYLDALDEKQTIAHMLCHLSVAYQRKYGYDQFTLNCANIALKYFPHSLQALIIKYNTHQMLGIGYIKKYGKVPSNYIHNNYTIFKTTEKFIDNLGYRELSTENYEKWLQTMEEERLKQKLEAEIN